jgi:hypothetical protein
VGGTGATAYWICQEALRNQRQQDAEIRRSRDLRRVKRLMGHPERVVLRQPFPCAHACTSCGWVVPPQARAGDPMRTDPTPAMPSACPRCGQRAWADLGEIGVNAAMLDTERGEIGLRSGIVPASLHGVGIIALSALTMTGIVVGVAPLLLLTAALVMLAVFIAICRRLSAGLSTPKRTAWRWHAPAQRFRAGRVLARGTVDGDALVCSPLTGRQGVAWRIEVRYPGDRGDAFALVEQGAAPLRIDGESIGPEPTIATGGTQVDLPREALSRFLASRGVDPFADARVTETIVTADTAVVVRRDRLGGPVVLCAR